MIVQTMKNTEQTDFINAKTKPLTAHDLSAPSLNVMKSTHSDNLNTSALKFYEH